MSDYNAIRAQLEDKLQQLVARAERIDSDLSETPDEDWEDRATELEDDEVMSSVGNATLEEILCFRCNCVLECQNAKSPGAAQHQGSLQDIMS